MKISGHSVFSILGTSARMKFLLGDVTLGFSFRGGSRSEYLSYVRCTIANQPGGVKFYHQYHPRNTSAASVIRALSSRERRAFRANCLQSEFWIKRED